MMKTGAKTSAKLTLISLYTGAGGLDLGFEAAGFSTKVAVELDANARATLQNNRPSWKQPEEGDALKLSAVDLLKLAGLERGQVDALIGGPPCQPFSKSAFWAAGSTRRLDYPRALTLGTMLDLTEAILPRVLVIENVRGIAYRKKDEAMKLVEERLTQINKLHGTSYTTTVSYLQATDFGVPQVRERAFLVSFRDGERFESPEPVAGAGQSNPVSTAWDAIGDLAPDGELSAKLAARGKWAELLPSIPEGQNYLWHTDRGDGLPLFGWRTRFWSFLLKLAKDKPAWTIQADPGPATGPFHWDSMHFQTAPWSGIGDQDTGAERQMIQQFLYDVIEAIANVADAPSVPIHFYVYSRSEMTQLVEACTRAGSTLLSHLRELLGSRQNLEQLIFSCIQDEIDDRFALGWTGRGLAVATSLTWFGQRYHWTRSSECPPTTKRGRIQDFGGQLLAKRSGLPSNSIWIAPEITSGSTSTRNWRASGRFPISKECHLPRAARIDVKPRVPLKPQAF